VGFSLEGDIRRRWLRVAQLAVDSDELRTLRLEIALVCEAPQDTEARERLRAITAQHMAWEQLAPLLAAEARLTRDPDVVAALDEETAHARAQLSQAPATLPILRSDVEREPGNPEHREQLAFAYYLAGVWSKAAEALEQLAARVAGDAAILALSAAGRLYRNTGHVDQSIAAYRAIVVRKPSNTEALLAIGELIADPPRILGTCPFDPPGADTALMLARPAEVPPPDATPAQHQAPAEPVAPQPRKKIQIFDTIDEDELDERFASVFDEGDDSDEPPVEPMPSTNIAPRPRAVEASLDVLVTPSPPAAAIRARARNSTAPLASGALRALATTKPPATVSSAPAPVPAPASVPASTEPLAALLEMFAQDGVPSETTVVDPTDPKPASTGPRDSADVHRRPTRETPPEVSTDLVNRTRTDSRPIAAIKLQSVRVAASNLAPATPSPPPLPPLTEARRPGLPGVSVPLPAPRARAGMPIPHVPKKSELPAIPHLAPASRPQSLPPAKRAELPRVPRPPLRESSKQIVAVDDLDDLGASLDGLDSALDSAFEAATSKAADKPLEAANAIESPSESFADRTIDTAVDGIGMAEHTAVDRADTQSDPQAPRTISRDAQLDWRARAESSTQIELDTIDDNTGSQPAVPRPTPRDSSAGFLAPELALEIDAAKADARAGRLDEAETRLRMVIEARPFETAIHVSLVDLLRANGRLDEADEHLDHALEMAPEEMMGHRAALLQRYALVMTAKGDSETAHDMLFEAHGLDPDRLTLVLALGESYFARDEWDDATRLLAPLAQHPDAPNHPRAVARGLVTAALAEIRLRRPTNATQLYHAALRIDPRCDAARKALAK